ncbi:MAG: histidinol-phosphatase [Bacteroidales bacterium]|nr:histidinol-phosphatase [Bacteroidales bacterium]MDY0217310.1 histidinol-phosphatase [Bacteroidales bacterium]
MKYNLHTHSEFCDGIAPLSHHCEFAISQNLKVLGFSSHAPLRFNNNFSIKESQIDKYISETDLCQEKFNKELVLKKGLECDYIKGLSYSFSEFKTKYNLDYIIGGIHLVGENDPKKLWFIDGPQKAIFDDGLEKLYQNDIKRAVTSYFHQMNEMIENEEFDILAHIDKIKMHNQSRFFRENEIWYQNLIDETLELVQSKDLITEVNYRGIYKKRCMDFYPSKQILQKMKAKNIRICISSDSHQPSEIGLLDKEAIDFVKSVGYKETYCLDQCVPLPN